MITIQLQNNEIAGRLFATHVLYKVLLWIFAIGNAIYPTYLLKET